MKHWKTLKPEDLTLEQKVGQMLFPAFRTGSTGEPLLEMEDALAASLRAWQPGGVVLFAANLDTVPQTATLIRDFQATAGIPLLMGVDEEGGLVSRFGQARNLNAVSMPAAAIIGRTGDPALATEAALAIADQIGTVGFNTVFAPVADVDTNPANPVIGTRAYGKEPGPVADMVTAALSGFGEGKVIPVVKHFPGHGDTMTDSHLGLASVPHDRSRMDEVELFPFRAAIAQNVPMVMTAHVNTPGISDKDLPATLNPDILTGLLRETLQFPGVIVTDAMEMGAITSFYGEEESIVMAVEAGADMLLVPVSMERAGTALLEAVRSGRLSEARIDASVRRILAMKAAWLPDKDPSEPLPQVIPRTDAHRELVARIQAAAETSR